MTIHNGAAHEGSPVCGPGALLRLSKVEFDSGRSRTTARGRDRGEFGRVFLGEALLPYASQEGWA